jgi:signal peptidase I
MERERYKVFAPISQITNEFGVRPGRLYREGETIARGVIETGDQVLVDKVSYHFAAPVQGDVFVFKTTGIRRIQASLPPGVDSQHYIKRLAGMPGQTLRIVPPQLLLDGVVAWQPAFQKVMSLRNGYRGYTNGLESGFPFQYLGTPQATFTVPKDSYFALGDNSYHSSDSRNWGIVPQENVAGRAVLVYWPISARWGFIY